MSVKASVVINASNLHGGGGVQVASSFIYEISMLECDGIELTILVSDEVANSLKRLGIDVDRDGRIKRMNVFGLAAVFSGLNSQLSRHDLVFTVFGPNYFRSAKYVDLVGFAQPWIIDKSGYHLLSLRSRLKNKLKFFLQRLFFKKSDALIVELEHVRDGLIRSKTACSDAIYVVYNCISSLYFKQETWQPLDAEIMGSKFKMGFLGRDYAHKNTAILPSVKRILTEKYGLDVDFFVTMNESEWSRKSLDFRLSITNVGSLAVTQCPSFYQALDAVIFPSLLECFSATPLEAMVMEKPLFASDRRFVRDVCGEFSFYFDPLDPEDAADVIAHYIRNQSEDSVRLAAAKEYAINFSSAKGRAERYLEIIEAELTKKHGQKI